MKRNLKKMNSLDKVYKSNNANGEEVYKMALEGAYLGLWDWNIKTDTVTYNEIWAEMLGYKPEDIRPHISSWGKLVHPDDWERVCFALDQHFAGKTDKYHCEYRMRTKNGNWKWILAIGNIVEWDEEGEPIRAVGVNEDIDRRKSIEFEMDKQRAFFEQLFEGSPAGIALLDDQERIIRINKSFQKMFNYRQRDVEGRQINDILVPDDKKEEGNRLTLKASKGETVVLETIRKASSGRLLNVIIFGYPVTINDEILGIFAVYQDITARKKEEDEIKYLSFHDQLTGLYNRRYFENELERLDKSRDLPIGIIVADLDYLKYVNDDFGHKKGDKYIKDAAAAIKKVIREEDIAARIGGDEFAMILPDVDEDILEDITMRIEKKYQELGESSNKLYHISMGYGVKEKETELLEDVFTTADRSMYINKENYKDTHPGKQKNKNS